MSFFELGGDWGPEMPKRGRAATAAACDSTVANSAVAMPFVDALKGAAITDVPIGDINFDDKSTQFRVTTRVDDLRASIERHGQSHPVDLFGTKPYRIVDGFRRVQAIRELGWPVVKAIIHIGITDHDAFRLAFTSNAARKNLSPIDKANAIRVCKQLGLKATETSTMFGLSERQLERYGRLLKFPKSLQELVDASEVSMAHAVVLAKFDKIDLVDWVEKLQEQKWSAGELRRELRKASTKCREPAPRRYFTIRDTVLRMRNAKILKDAPLELRERFVAECKLAIRFAET